MEAISLYTFEQKHNNSNNLSFSKDTKIIITSFTDKRDWYKVELDSNRQYDDLDCDFDVFQSDSNSSNSNLNNSNLSNGSKYHNRTNSMPFSFDGKLSNNKKERNLSSHQKQQSTTNKSYNYKRDSGHQTQNPDLEDKISSDLRPNLSPISFSNMSSTSSTNLSFVNKTRSRSIFKGWVPKNYFKIKFCPWFYGPVDREFSNRVLKSCNVGQFLIRQDKKTNQFCLSVKTGDVLPKHYKILRDQMGNFLLFKQKFSSINKLVEFYHNNPLPNSKFTKKALPGSILKRTINENAEIYLIGDPNFYQNINTPYNFVIVREEYCPPEVKLNVKQNIKYSNKTSSNYSLDTDSMNGYDSVSNIGCNDHLMDNVLVTTEFRNEQTSSICTSNSSLNHSNSSLNIDTEKAKIKLKMSINDKILVLDKQTSQPDHWLGQLLPNPELNINSSFQVGIFDKNLVIEDQVYEDVGKHYLNIDEINVAMS